MCSPGEAKIFVLLILLVPVTCEEKLSCKKKLTLKIKVGHCHVSFSHFGRKEDTISDAEAHRFRLRPEKKCLERFPTLTDPPTPPTYCYLKKPINDSSYPAELTNYEVKSLYRIKEIKVLQNLTQRVFISEIRHKNSSPKSAITIEFNNTSFRIMDRIYHEIRPWRRGTAPHEKLISGAGVSERYTNETGTAFDINLNVEYEALGLGDYWSYSHTLGTQEEKRRPRDFDMDITFKKRLAPRTCSDFRTFAFVRILELEILYVNYLTGKAIGVWVRDGFFWDEYGYFSLDTHFLQNQRFTYRERIRLQVYTGGQLVVYDMEDDHCDGSVPGHDLLALVLHEPITYE